MKRSIATLLLSFVGGTALALAQVRPPSPIKPPEPITGTDSRSSTRTNGGSITVEGCLHGSSLEPLGDRRADQVLTLYGATSYDLEISRALKERLIGHDGHAERVTGTLSLPPDDGRVVLSKGFGSGTRVTGSTAPTTNTPAHGVPAITVKSIEHLADRCATPPQRDPDPNRTGDVLQVPQPGAPARF
jgi:hypothetical protein